MKTQTLRAIGAPVLTLVLAAGLTACSSDDSTGKDDTRTSTTTTDDSATPQVASSVSISEPWARGTVDSTDPSMSAVFMLLDNLGDADVVLTSAVAEVAGRTELHQMAMKDGDMVMQKVAGGITIEAGKDMLLQPGGYHVMLMDLTEELVPGTEIELQLAFSDGATQTITVPVKEFTEEEGHYHEPGTPEHTHGGDELVVPEHDHSEEHDSDGHTH